MAPSRLMGGVVARIQGQVSLYAMHTKAARIHAVTVAVGPGVRLGGAGEGHWEVVAEVGHVAHGCHHGADSKLLSFHVRLWPKNLL